MNSKLTREQATDTEIQMLIDSHEKGTAMFMRTDAYYFMAKELQERRKTDVAPAGYFAFDNDGGFTNHDTAESARKEAQEAINYFRGDACDGWPDEVGSVCWGVIMQQSTKTDERPVEEGDKCSSHIERVCDYVLLPELQEKPE